MDHAVPQTQKLYSVHNTPEPLQLKVRAVPCLCPVCITEEGDCENSEHTDPWKVVDLVPEKGANLRKYQKKKRPDEHVRRSRDPDTKVAQCETNTQSNQPLEVSTPEEIVEEDSDEELPTISIGFDLEKHLAERRKKRMQKKAEEKIISETDAPVTDAPVTDDKDKQTTVCSWVNISEEILPEDFESICNTPKSDGSDDIEIIEVCERNSREFQMSGDNLLQQQQQIKYRNQCDRFGER